MMVIIIVWQKILKDVIEVMIFYYKFLVSNDQMIVIEYKFEF